MNSATTPKKVMPVEFFEVEDSDDDEGNDDECEYTSICHYGAFTDKRLS